ncbi:DUF1934 family protein [Globicatella sulfidifaciens]|uniref:Uncharacterized beta-barrel protein YwiB, DUF1934 family n=2 Tax=Globicatella sulfidifaciens TaxID=136093 RepID=A0A1T4JV47_9LACT|nr:DUF1934 domain-containing protein [Globicatella sulfidifaciens]NLJ18550.1 DUF1934 domain-containing protein [Globicatella sulfidifaciens]SJZ34036.1 Uncharacterized beta-barrel protein YwiB, DUF1934 family [Globicatella sulfidifaciens DSM 15739]
MKRESVTVKVTQKIMDSTTKRIEKWRHQTQGEYYQLNSFEKITYEDQQGQVVHVKWFPNNENLEISYGSTRLLFNKEEPTQLVYSTPQGLMVFDVLTHRISIADNKISVDYQLLNENKPIGDYDFRLIYHQ